MKWGIVAKARINHVRENTQKLMAFLEENGQTVLMHEDLANELGPDDGPGYSLDALHQEADLFMTVGGDGTILMTLHHTDKPIFGVNSGAVGFLAEVEPDEAPDAILEILAGNHRIEERPRLAVSLDGERLPDATNEVTLQTSRVAKLIKFRVDVDGEELDVFRGDGIIVSTATGSTGYAMSVGGPLVHPRVAGMVLAPIAPFRLAARPWMLPEDACVTMELLDRDSAHEGEQARVVVDGQYGTGTADGVIEIRKAERKARFVRLGRGFYSRVRNKLVR